MKRSGSRSRLRRGARELDARGLSQIGTGLDSLVQNLPNNQNSELDIKSAAIPMTELLTFDLRTKKQLMNIKGEPVKPVELVIDGRSYKNQVRFGGYRFETPMDTTKIVGLTNFGDGLYVQPSPLQPFLSVGQHAVGVYESEHGKIDNTSEVGKIKGTAQIAAIVRDGAFEGGGRNYRNACFEVIHEDSPNKTITVLVLGPQREDGRHENAEAYEELASVEKKQLSPNIHEFQGMQEVQGNNGERINVRVIHANVSKFDAQHLDSRDLETLATVYADTLGQGNPLTIHCTDGLDRAGGISFAMHLMKNYERVFVPGNDNATLANVINEHDYMQGLRGGYFCTANETRLAGATQLATIMKSIELSRTLFDRLQNSDPEMHGKLDGKDYVDQIGILRNQKALSPSAKELLSVLEVRARTEQIYFSKLSNIIRHPMVEKFLLQQIEKEDRSLYNKLIGKNYVDQINILLGKKELTPSSKDLLHVLVKYGRNEIARESDSSEKKYELTSRFINEINPRIVEQEKVEAKALWEDINIKIKALGEPVPEEFEMEFAKISYDLSRPKYEPYQFIDSISKLHARVEKEAPRIKETRARGNIEEIERMLLKGHNLDPLIKRRGQDSQQQIFLAKYNEIKAKIADGENPARFLGELIGLKAQLEATRPNLLQAAQYKKYVTAEHGPEALASAKVTAVDHGPEALVSAKASAVEPMSQAGKWRAAADKHDQPRTPVQFSRTKKPGSPRGEVPQAEVGHAENRGQTLKQESPGGEVPQAEAGHAENRGQTLKQESPGGEVPQAEAGHPENRRQTLIGAMLSKRTSGDAASVQGEHEVSEEAKQFSASAARVKGLAVLAESGPPAFEITLNNFAGDYKGIVAEAKHAASKTGATVIEFEDQCVIKTENASIHLSKAENGQTKLEVRSQADKQDKAFEDASAVVRSLGDKDLHHEGSLKDNTGQKNVQSKIEELHAERQANIKY